MRGESSTSDPILCAHLLSAIVTVRHGLYPRTLVHGRLSPLLGRSLHA